VAESLTGVLERIIFLNEENAYTIAEFRPEHPDRPKRSSVRDSVPTVTILGALPGVECGETLHLTGEWTRHREHGAQFKITAFRSELPSSVHGIRKYLGSGLVPGIGRVYANKIVDAFGADTFRVLSEESARLRTVEGIGRKRATAIKQAWDEKRAERELYIFLQTYGVTPGQCVKLVNRFGAEAKSILMHEPYRAAREIEGIGFRTADRIAINLGFANDAPPRIDAGLLFALETLQEEGHTAFPEADLIQHAAELLQTPSERIEARIEALVNSKDLVRQSADGYRTQKFSQKVAKGGEEESTEDRQPTTDAPATPSTSSGQAATGSPAYRPTVIQLPVLDRAEARIAGAVARITRVASGLPPIKVEAAVAWAEERAGFEFHDLQRSAVRHALTHKFSILTGGPGTGKTTILRALVQVLKAKRARVHLAAPTGRAAQRLAETTGGFASTIHRLLKFDPAGGGFQANEKSPLATDFLIVDEASMLDTRLAAAVLQAVPSRAHVVLVGDTDQLPSVGAGNVLKDLIAIAGQDPQSAIPVTRLSVIYRQEGQSAIVTAAHAINGGEAGVPVPPVREIGDAPVWADLCFIQADSQEECLAKTLELCAQFIPRKLKWPHPVRDVQVLAPMHKGVAGVANLNLELQGALNPPRGGQAAEFRAPGGTFRPGDKLIQLRNNYDKGLFNGDIGTVTSIDSQGNLVTDFDGERHEFARSESGDLALAYCISIHKSQGSEYPVVVIPLLKAHYMMLQRNLLYTAVTRGRKKVFIVGDPAAYAMAVRNSESRRRVTWLRERMAAGISGILNR
jgi:exodeoxyribonuclease V alpha subunit